MNAELVSSELDSEATWSRPSLAEANGECLGGWWDHTLTRLDVGECARTPEAVARAFEATPDSVRSSRELATGTAREWGLVEVAEDLRLVVSELVGNACRHAVPRGRSPEGTRVLVQFRLLRERRQVVCMVADQVEHGPVKVEAHHFAESGRGLGLVAAFSRTWGWDPVRGEGKIVWAVCGGED
ncbi:ATP-binding protein [Nocardiopsis sp. EMB25]|uniref:ATP-binding protein n=1 Tax=Nocardiopsis TaxID=2013 RepID=UPI00037DB1FB|nr:MULTISPECIES: ATP-binding protein [Nocardiopsis]MCY9785983.1 ATP-binding protein [Nocardiopsis sp. EMB25]